MTFICLLCIFVMQVSNSMEMKIWSASRCLHGISERKQIKRKWSLPWLKVTI